MNVRKVKNLILVLFICMSTAVYGQSARTLVKQGNNLYAEGDFGNAIEKYDKALVEKPEILEPKFNKANSFYKLEDFSEAIDLYRQVAAESKDMSLVTKAKYNLGNCYFSQGIKQQDSDLQKALEDLQNSIVQDQRGSALTHRYT